MGNESRRTSPSVAIRGHHVTASERGPATKVTRDSLLQPPDLRHCAATAGRRRSGMSGVKSISQNQSGDRRHELIRDCQRQPEPAVTRSGSLHFGRLRVSAIPAHTFKTTGTVRTLVRFVIVVSVYVSNRQAVVVMVVPVIPLFTVMLVTMNLVVGVGMLDKVTLMFMPSDTTFDDMPMLTGMSVVRATSENRMQQHYRHRQNAGQGLKHEVFTALRTRRHSVRRILCHVFSSAQSELSLECETGQSK